jgi:hypothetical protein
MTPGALTHGAKLDGSSPAGIAMSSKGKNDVDIRENNPSEKQPNMIVSFERASRLLG